MAEKIATREAYGKALAALAEKYPDLVCFDADLAGATMTKYFKAACPERFFDMGIAEADMVGVAAGMSLCGFKPFVNTFAMFAAGRAWEQVRNSVAYPHLNVKVVGSHGGLSVGEDGATHQCIEDFAIMRAIPGMLVLCPCDGNEMRLAVEALVNYEGPAYMRLGRLAVETVTDSIPGYKFELGKGATLRDGTDVTIIAVGMNVQMALAAADKLAAEGVSARVIDMHTIKPLDTELVLKAAKETGAIVTTEEANVLGGLGAGLGFVRPVFLLRDLQPQPVAVLGGAQLVGTGLVPFSFGLFGTLLFQLGLIHGVHPVGAQLLVLLEHSTILCAAGDFAGGDLPNHVRRGAGLGCFIQQGGRLHIQNGLAVHLDVAEPFGNPQKVVGRGLAERNAFAPCPERIIATVAVLRVVQLLDNSAAQGVMRHGNGVDHPAQAGLGHFLALGVLTFGHVQDVHRLNVQTGIVKCSRRFRICRERQVR